METTLDENTEAATRAASALDLESDAVPEKLRCPVCMEVYLGEVYQCPNGHPICKECQTKSGQVICSQCRKGMKSVDGDWIRNRYMEEELDAHSFFCPFRKNGCQEILSRGDVRDHKEECVFDGNHIQICKYFLQENDSEQECVYFIHPSKPNEALAHLEKHFNYFTYIDEEEETWWWFPVSDEDNWTDAVCKEAAVTYQNGGTFMTVGWYDPQTDQLSFVCLRMDEPAPGQVESTTVKLTFENQKEHAKIPNLSLMLPIISVLEAEPILERPLKPVSVSRFYLKDSFLDEDFDKPHEDCIKVNVEIL